MKKNQQSNFRNMIWQMMEAVSIDENRIKFLEKGMVHI